MAVAILDAGLICTASLPCPAEMGGSIHISGTGSSIVDTIFVCRSTGVVRRIYLADTSSEIAALVQRDVSELEASEYHPTRGDVRCLIFGHLIRLAVWKLRDSWDRSQCSEEKLLRVEKQVSQLGGLDAVELEFKGHNTKRLSQHRLIESARIVTQFS
jgi:hypothetical protein